MVLQGTHAAVATATLPASAEAPLHSSCRRWWLAWAHYEHKSQGFVALPQHPPHSKDLAGRSTGVQLSFDTCPPRGHDTGYQHPDINYTMKKAVEWRVTTRPYQQAIHLHTCTCCTHPIQSALDVKVETPGLLVPAGAGLHQAGGTHVIQTKQGFAGSRGDRSKGVCGDVGRAKH